MKLHRNYVGLATVPTFSDVVDHPIAAGTVARPTNPRSFFLDQTGCFREQRLG
jgi:hypothetical protein